MKPLPYEYITEMNDMEGALETLSSCAAIGVDIEGDSLYHYQDKVCLIQISGNGKNFIFDPLRLESVDSLSALLQNEKIVKIFHGAEYDLISLKRDFHFSVHSIFDTVLAARAIGLKVFGLRNLVSLYFNVQLEKSHQKANWSKRPIPHDQLDYAYKDTFYLPELYERLLIEVRNKGRLDQIEEECRLLETREWEEKEFTPGHYLKIKGARELSSLSQKILRELVAAREELARRVDRPPFKVIGNEELILMASKKVRSLKELKTIFPRESASVYRDPVYWLKAVALGERSQEPLPQKPRKNGVPPTPEQEKRFGELKKWRDGQAIAEGVEPAMIISTESLRTISRAEIQRPEQLVEEGHLRHWQFRRYAPKILSYFP